MSVYSELRRRNVLRVGAAYVVVAWLMIQVAETIFPLFGFGDTPARVVVIVAAIGFVPAIVLSWIFQFTPEGLQLDTGELPAAPQTTRLLDRAIVVVLLLGISYFAFDKFVLAPERAAEREAQVAEQAKQEAVKGFYGDRSIAVLPFENMSADPEQQFFVDGVAEELLHLLAKIQQIRVISRSSSFALRDLDLETREIAERLDVGHVLEGSVRKMGDTVRVTVKLIDARTDAQLWSEKYDHKLANVFAIQDEIAHQVADQMKIKLLRPLPASRKVDPEAVALTQQARMIGETSGFSGGTKMNELIGRAIEIDPGYVQAWEQKLSADLRLMYGGLIGQDVGQQRYEENRDRILELEPENALVDTTDGILAMMAGKYEEAATLFERAISRDPNNSEAARFAGGFARGIGKFEVAIRLGEHAVALDPLCYYCLWDLSRTYLYAGEYAAAAKVRNRYLALGEGGGYHYGLMLLLQGKVDEALEYFQSMESINPQKYAGLAIVNHELGNHDTAEDEFARLMSMGADGQAYVGGVAAWMGKRDFAFEWLTQSAEQQSAWTLGLMGPALRGLRDDPRWEEFLESVGFSAARLDAIDFDPVLPK